MAYAWDPGSGKVEIEGSLRLAGHQASYSQSRRFRTIRWRGTEKDTRYAWANPSSHICIHVHICTHRLDEHIKCSLSARDEVHGKALT